MPTRLSRFCDGLIESAWLAAVILVPIFFDIYSSRIFEPDKITLLRSLALVILIAWIVKIIEERGIHWERVQPGDSLLKFITKIPLVLPVTALAVLYIVSTIFSITPLVSLLGSYQRLQGMYTTFSYLVVFAAIVGNMRKRVQVERLITAIIMCSLPIALYGVLQRYKIDPVPWGGDTSLRIASNMGNSIFVAAYLIMVFPLTIGRVVQSFGAILKDEGKMWPQVARATVYVFAAAIQVIALYMSGSRGPALGWMAGSFFLFLLLSLHWNKRWLTFSSIGAALALGVFLFIFNIPNGPLESLRSSPAIGRFGLLLDAESNSALVRKYIWQGAADLVAPHEPLEFPDGSKDRLNALRLILGYGPESMYVAYNPFYVPDLAHVEKRNASPDRSHNETWDALVITGILGILVYLFLFTLVFYYSLKWIGLIIGKNQRNLFLSLVVGGGFIGAVGLAFWRGFEYFGVGLPFGMLIGLLGYITLAAVFTTYKPPDSPAEGVRSLTLIFLVAAIVSHFVEINFGIAIAVTRTYFWVYAAIMVVVGYILPLYGEYGFQAAMETSSPRDLRVEGKKQEVKNLRKKRTSRGIASTTSEGWLARYREVGTTAILLSLPLVTLGFNFVTNPRGLKSGLSVLWASFTTLPNRNFATSYGVLALILTAWLFIAIVYTSEITDREDASWWKVFAQLLGISGTIVLFFWLIHSGSIASMARSSATSLEQVMSQVGRYEGLLGWFYIYIFTITLFLGLLLASAYLLPKSSRASPVGVFAGLAGLIIVVILISITNLRVIQADIVFKLAEPFTRSGQWPVAISIYERANELAPREDYYYLFLGRAYLEHAKTLSDANERDALINKAKDDLLKAQSINPLNTDHTANLARLYSLWASYATTDDERTQRMQKSDQYFSRAVILSPQSARLWDEWSLLYLNVEQNSEEALSRLNKALEIDPEYHWTYALIGETYLRDARASSDVTAKQSLLEKGVEYYNQALELPTPGEPLAWYNYALAIGGAYSQMGKLTEAIQAYERAVEVAPASAEIWRVEEAIGSLYASTGDSASALVHVQNAYNGAPDAEKARLKALVGQLQSAQP